MWSSSLPYVFVTVLTDPTKTAHPRRALNAEIPLSIVDNNAYCIIVGPIDRVVQVLVAIANVAKTQEMILNASAVDPPF